MTLALLCGKCLKDRAHPSHDPDLPEHYDHDFKRVEIVESPKQSVWTQKSWWVFLAIAAGFLALAILLAGS